MIWAEPIYTDSVPRISWYNLLTHLPVGSYFFHPQIRTTTAIESLKYIIMYLCYLHIIKKYKKNYQEAILGQILWEKNLFKVLLIYF